MKNNFYNKNTKLKFTRWFVCSMLFMLSIISGSVNAQLSGTKNIPGDYATLAAAITDLNTQGVASPGVVLNLIAGNPETAPVGGYIIGGAGSAVLTTAAAGAPITIQGNGNTITASAALTVGSVNDALFKLVGADFTTIDGFILVENPANTVGTSAATNNMTEWGVALVYVTTTNGAQDNTIKNCTIDLDRTYVNTVGIYSNSTHALATPATSATATTLAGGNSRLSLTGNNVTDVNVGIIVVGPTAAADNNDGLTIGMVGFGNVITNYGTAVPLTTYANVSGTIFGILVRNTKNYNVNNNTVTSSNGGVTASTAIRGIFINAFSAAPTGTITNNINNNTISLTGGNAAHTTHHGIGIEATTGNATTTLNVNGNNFANWGWTVAATGAIVFINDAMATLNTNFNSNTFTNLSIATTGSVTFISHTLTLPANGTQSVSNNSIVGSFTKTGAGGTVLLFTNNGSSPATVTENYSNNNFSNITLSGATTITGFRGTDGGSPVKTVSNNIFSNWVTGSGGTTALAISFSGSANVSGNVVNGIFATGGTVIGIESSSGTQIFANNSISQISSTGSGDVRGFSITSGTTQTLSKNVICNLENTNSAGTVSGIFVSGSTTVNIANNLVGDLRTPNANAANPLNGINITGSTTENVVYNTVYISTTSSGALFGSSAISASTTPNLTLVNNILINNSVPKGAGLAVAYRRSSTTLTTYNNASDRNIFYAPTIFTDGTNTFSVLGPGVGTYKNHVAAPRDVNSFSENVPFLSITCGDPTFLHINPATPTSAESGGINITGIVDDIDNQTRFGNPGYVGSGTAPDIGADEVSGTPLPACSGTPTAGTINGVNAVCSGLGTTLTLTGTTLASGLLYQWSSGTTSGGPYPTNLGTSNSQATGALTTTTYYVVTVTCSNGGGASTSAEKQVLVNANPTVTANPPSSSYCVPYPGVSLTAGGATTYVWSPTLGLSASTGANVTATPGSNTTYTVTGTDNNGCINTATAAVSSGTGPTNLVATANPTSLCTGGTTTLSATSTVAVATTANGYSFSAGSGASLDPMTGATDLICCSAPVSVGFGDDDIALSSPAPIGFNFIFEGTTYTAYSVSPDGFIKLGSVVADEDFGNGVADATNLPKIYPLWDDLCIGTDGHVRVLVTGSAPSRIFKMQWQVTIPRNLTGASNATFQCWLYETSNIIEFRYGTITNAATSASGGITGLNNANWESLTYSSNTISTSTANNTNTTMPASGTIYTFSPPLINPTYSWAPAASLVTTTGSTVNSVALSTTTVFTVTATNGACSTTSTVTVPVGTTLVCGALTTSGNPCAGVQTVTAHPSGGGTPYTYAWTEDGNAFGGNTATILASPGSHTYNCQVTDFCNNTCLSGNLVVVTNSAPPVAVNPTSGLICNPNGASVTLTASGASSYTWSPAAGLNVTTGSAVIANPSASTTFTVTGTDGNGCLNTATAVINVSTTPYFTLNPSSVDICNGASTILNVNNSFSGSFTYTTTVTIPVAGTTTGNADPYPATLTVSGVPLGAVLRNVKLDGLTHPNVPDLDILLQSPLSTNVVLMSDEFSTVDAVGINLTIQDGGTAMTTSIDPVSGTYAPSNSGATDTWTPGPGSVTQATPLLSGFGNGNMNGVWNLYITDDLSSNIGAITSWSLTFEIPPDPSVNYIWSPNSGLSATTGLTVTANPSSTTVYTVVGTGTGGCTASGTVTVNVGSPLVCNTITRTGTLCNSSTIDLTAHPSGGGAPYSYSWSDGSTTVYPNSQNISVSLTTGTYTFTAIVTDNCGSTCSSNITVTINPLPSVAVNPTSGTICNPGGTAVNLTASGATSYTWSPSSGLSSTTGTTVSAFPLQTTSYTVTGTDANGCVASSASTVTLSSAVSITSVVASNSSVCNGGSSDLTASGICLSEVLKITEVTQFRTGTGQTSPYPAFVAIANDDYLEISNISSTTADISGYVYEIWLSAALDRSYTFPASTTIPGNSVLVVGIGTGTDDIANRFYNTGGTNDHLSSASIAGHLLKRGSVIVDAVALNGYSFPAASGVTAADWSGNIASSSGFAGVTRTAATDGNVASDWVISSAGSPQTVGTYNGGFVIPSCALNYTWTPSTYLTSTTGSTVSATGIASTTTWTVTATGDAGCSATGTVTVTAGSALVCGSLTASATKCASTDFTVTSNVSGGGSPYTYTWSDGGTTIYPNAASITANLPAGSYTFTLSVTDACGATCQTSLLVTVNPAPNITVSPSSGQICNPGGAAVTFTASGGVAYTVTPLNGVTQLSANSASAQPLTTTIYTVYGQDANGCTNSATVPIQVGSYVANINPTATPPDVCPGTFSQLNAGGSLVFSPNPSTYSFVPSSGTFTPLSGGTNVSAVQDDDVVSGPIPIGFAFSYNGTTFTSLIASSNGFISFNPSAGSNLTNTIGAVPTTAAPLIAPLWDDMDGGDAGGVATYLTTGSTGSRVFTFEWINWEWIYSSNVATINFQVKLYEADSHIEFIYQDAGNAGAPGSASIGLAGTGTYLSLDNSSASPTASASVATNTIAAKPANGQVYAFYPPNTGITYSWAPAAGLKPNANVQSPETPGLLTTTVYTVTATNNGCSSTATVTINVNPLTCTPATHSAITCAGNNFTVTAHPVGGGAPYSYAWSDGVGGVYPNSQTITVNLPSGTYAFDCTITDDCGSSCLSSVNVTVLDNPSISVNQTAGLICNPGGTSVTLSVVGGGAGNYIWSPTSGLNSSTATTVVANPPVSTTYTVTLTDGNGCVSSAGASIVVDGKPSISFTTPTTQTICPGSQAELTILSAFTGTFTGGSITIPSGAPTTTIGPASPYPATIAVTGVPFGATLKSISINGLTSTFVPDMDMVLQSPTNVNVVFMSDAFNTTTDATNNNIVIQDGAPTMATTLGIADGTWGPTNNATTTDDWVAPGPGSLTQTTPLLSDFGSGDQNGTWKLFIVDDASLDVHSITSWSLTFEASTNPNASYTWAPSNSLNTSTGLTVFAAPASSTTYTVTGSVPSGCTSSATATVNIVVIDDGNACTNDFCDTQTGTAFHTNVNIDDGDPCTTDACDTNTGNITHTPSCGVTLNSSIFIQGYYSGGGLMEVAGAGTLFIDGIPGATPTDADTVSISAMDPISPYALVQEQKGILHTNGTISVTFTSPVTAGNSYYLRLLHRNSVETWSAAPVTLSAVGSYLFSTAATQAFAANQADLGDGNFAIFSGDINHDGAVDGSDFLELDPSIQNGDGGYAPGDLNGDGAVDGSDFLVLDPNIQNGIGAALP